MRRTLFVAIAASMTLPGQLFAADHVIRVERESQQQISVQRQRQSAVQQQLRSRDGSAVLQRDGGAASAGITTPGEEGALWHLLSRGRLHALEEAIAAERIRRPGWQPSVGLLRELYLARLGRRVAVAVRSQDDRALLRLYRASPADFSCRRSGWSMSLAAAQMRLDDRGAAVASYRRLLRACKAVHRLDALAHANGVLPFEDWEPLVEAELQRPHGAALQERVGQLAYRLDVARLQRFMQLDAPEATMLAARIAPQAAAAGDVGTQELCGWAAFRDGDYDLARMRFERVLAAQGPADQGSIESVVGMMHALAALQDGARLHAAYQHYRDLIASGGKLGDLLPLLAYQAIHDGRPGEAYAYFAETAAIRPLSERERAARAWAAFNSGRDREAATAFERLYRARPLGEYARGLHYALVRSGEIERLKALAGELGGALAATGSDAAAGLIPPGSESARLEDVPRLSAGFMSLRRGGRANVLGRLDLRKWFVEGRWQEGRQAYWLTAERFHTDAGGAVFVDPFIPLPGVAGVQPGERVGTMNRLPGQLNYARAPRSHYVGYEWSAGYSRAGRATGYAEVGQLVTPGAIHGYSMKWRLGARAERADYGWQLEAYRQPVRESLLSYVGMIDPYLGVTAWGKVSKTGGRLTAHLQLADDLSVDGYISDELRTGTNVQANQYASAYAAVSYAMHPTGFEYFTLGPVLRWEHAGMNQLHYTVGHGGYFSPQRLLDWGVRASFASEQGRRWLLVGNAYVGKQTMIERASQLFPLAPNYMPPGMTAAQLTYLPARYAELHWQAELHAVYAMDERWRIGLGYYYGQSRSLMRPRMASIRDQAVMIGFTRRFGDAGLRVDRQELSARRFSPLF